MNKVSEHLKKSSFLRISSIIAAFGSTLIWLSLVANANFQSLTSLLSERHPYLGWSDWVMQDMKATARGMFIYSNPDAGYTGLLYTPLFTFINANATLMRISLEKRSPVARAPITIAKFFVHW